MAEQAAALQSRLSAVFGGLARPGDDQHAPWQPSTAQVFRVGGQLGDQDGGSSDEEAEFEERARREVVPGLAMDLATEDEPDAEGFRPSTAFCRALDREEEYSAVDEVAMGTYRGRTAEALPPRSMEVLEDNVWEQRIAQREAHQHAGEVPELAAPAAMETDLGAPGPNQTVEQQAEQRGTSAAGEEGAMRRGSSEGSEGATAPRSALVNGSPRAKQSPKRVRFQGVSEPWVPPHRREGFVSRDPHDQPPPEDHAAAPARRFATVPPRRRGGRPSLSSVPDHVKHPEKYTLYTLDEPLVVGGGVGQLGSEGRNELEQAEAARPSAGEAPSAAAEEPERWQGAVGAGIEFRPKAQRSGVDAHDLKPFAVNGNARAAGGGAAQGAAVRLSMTEDEGEPSAQELGESVDVQVGSSAGEGQSGSGGGDLEMAEANAVASQQQQQQATAAAHFKPRAKSGRGYRTKAAAEGED